MADMNIPANDAPAEQAHAVAPPTRTDDQNFSSSNLVPIGKSNCVLDVQKSQRNLIFPIVGAILKNTNFFRAFTASFTIPAIYIQQFWDTMCFNSSTRLYSYQLDEQWFNLHKDILRDALDITPTNDNNPFTKTSCAVDSVRKNLAAASHGKKKTTHLLIPSVRFTKLIIHHLKIKHNIHPRSEEGEATESPKATKVTKPKAAKVIKLASDPKPKPAPTQPSKVVPEKKRKVVQETPDKPSPAKRSKGGLVRKIRKPMSLLKLVDEPSAEDVSIEKPAYNEEEANLQRALELSLKEQAERTQGPTRLVVDEQAAHDLHTLQSPKNKIPVDQFMFKKGTSMPTEASRPVESPSLDVELALTDSETESDDVVPKINTRDQDEGQAGQNPGIQDEGHAGPNSGVQDEGRDGSNPGDAIESQPQSSHVVHAGPNLKPMDLEATDALLLQNPEQLDEEFTTTTYPNVQENLKPPSEDPVIPEEPSSSTGTLSSLQNLKKELSFTDQFFVEKQQEEEPGKTNAEAKVQSMVSVPFHQDTSLVPPMTTSVIDLTTTADPTLMKCIDELEQHMANLLQYNLALEERLDKHGSQLYKLENLNIPHHVSKAVDEIVTDAVDWAMQALFRARFSDLPTVDMKKILQQWMFEDKSYEAHEDHKKLTPSESPPPQPSPPPPSAGASGAPGTSGASESSQFPPPPLPSSTGTSRSGQQQGSKALSSSKYLCLMMKTLGMITYQQLIREKAAYETPAENSLLKKNRDVTNFLNRYCRQFQMEECHKMLTDQVDWTNPKGDQVRINVNRPLPLGGSLGHVTIQTQFFFNKDLEYLRYGSKGSSPALSISKMKAASYPYFGLELLVPEKMWIDDVCTYDISAKYVRPTMRILSVIRIKAYSRYGYDYLSEIFLRRADFQEHTIAEKDFKNLHPSDFEDLDLLLLQGHLDHLPGSDKRMLSTAIKLWNQNLVI
uniref:Monodehydroascorbate reductase n=1 Tax=Tanacetum cinerariifolium TaxID=118510 RepID=A0A6L2NR46_TANCI|nr:hypothetical protein [Tanacetum cinerariifolium]